MNGPIGCWRRNFTPSSPLPRRAFHKIASLFVGSLRKSRATSTILRRSDGGISMRGKSGLGILIPSPLTPLRKEQRTFPQGERGVGVRESLPSPCMGEGLGMGVKRDVVEVEGHQIFDFK